MSRPWDDLISEQDQAVIERAGYAKHGAASWDSRRLGDRPALVVIDMQRLLVGEDVPILTAVEGERMAMGEIAWRALDPISSIVAACRAASVPILFTRVIPSGRTVRDASLQIVDQLMPLSDEVVLDKRSSSAFFETDLVDRLREAGVDTIILVGNSTSGCVRATAVDGRSLGFAVVVPEECTFDRIEASHKIGLLDLWMKYARVISLEETLEYLRGTRNLDALEQHESSAAGAKS